MKFAWQKYVLYLGILLCYAVQTASGQVRSATITGTVTDSSGALVVDADVIARDEATNVEYTGKTTQAGQYTIPYLATGTYTVIASKTGFQRFTATGVHLGTSQTVKVDGTLAVGAATAQVEVQSSEVQLQTESTPLRPQLVPR